jgi:tetratricopeptide (TPR) repeat protein
VIPDSYDPPDGRGPSLEAGRQLILARRPELAERELRRFLSAYPESPQGHALLAWSLAQQGQPDEAVRSGEEAVRLAPDWAYTHAVLAEVQLEVDRHADAERSVLAALALDPSHAGYHAILAAALLNQGRERARDALRAAEAGLALDADDADCARLRAQALMRLGRRREAREAAALALQLAPEASATHAAAGWIELGAGNLPRSREHLREALRMDPMNHDAARGLRLVGDGPRFCAALVVQLRAWAWRLAAAAALFAAELTALRAWEGPGDVRFALACLGYVLVALGGPILWIRLRRPKLLAELRQPGALAPHERRDARWALALAVALLLVVPLGMLID